MEYGVLSFSMVGMMKVTSYEFSSNEWINGEQDEW